MSKIRILDAELKCLTCGQKTKLVHMKCARDLRNKAVEEALNKERKEFLEDLDKISKIIMGGCPKVNVITEIISIKKQLEARLQE